MVSAVSLRFSWICLLMFSSGACFPFKNEYKYPYARVSTGPTPASDPLDDSTMTFQSGPAAYRPPAPPTGKKSPLSLVSPNKTTGSSTRYQLNRFVPDSRPVPVAPPKVPGYSAYAPPAGEALRKSSYGTSLLGPYMGRPEAGAESSSSHNQMHAWVFPDFSVWDSAAKMPGRARGRPSGSAPSTVIVQSRNGYWRAAVRSSRSRYTPEYLDQQVP